MSSDRCQHVFGAEVEIVPSDGFSVVFLDSADSPSRWDFLALVGVGHYSITSVVAASDLRSHLPLDGYFGEELDGFGLDGDTSGLRGVAAHEDDALFHFELGATVLDGFVTTVS